MIASTNIIRNEWEGVDKNDVTYGYRFHLTLEQSESEQSFKAQTGNAETYFLIYPILILVELINLHRNKCRYPNIIFLSSIKLF